GTAQSSLGSSIVLTDAGVIVGAQYDDENGQSAGALYMFEVATPCNADLNDDGMLNFFDISAFLTMFLAQAPEADFTGDGLFNFFDVSAFLSAFSAGCP